MLTGWGSIKFSALAINFNKNVLFPDELGPAKIIPNGNLNFKSLEEIVERSIYLNIENNTITKKCFYLYRRKQV
jgi:hypothetical protein